MSVRRRRQLDYWPGFVDALAALLMVLIFVILLFVIGQFALSDAISGRDQTLSRLYSQLEVLADALSLERDQHQAAERRLEELSASLASLGQQRDQLHDTLQHTQTQLAERDQQLAESSQTLTRLSGDILLLEQYKRELEQELSQRLSALDETRRELGEQSELAERSLVQVELLNRQLAALREQLTRLNEALVTSETERAQLALQVDELGRELNLALVAQVRELNQYRSEFFGRLRALLGEREDVYIVGDRFVFASEVLFPTGSDEVTAQGEAQLRHIANTLLELAQAIPDELPWVLQVDGHTDRRPIATERFPSNWELSTARAVAIVKILREAGVPPQRLAATGYGEYHPLDSGDDAAAHARNRRIELKLTSR